MEDFYKKVLSRAKDLWDRLAVGVELPPLPFPNLDAPLREGEGGVLKVPMAIQVDGFSCGVVAGWTVIKSIYPNRGHQDFVDFYQACNPDVCEGRCEKGWILPV